MTSFFSSLWTSVIEYETPRLVRIHNRKLGLVRRLIQASIVAYVCLYALWLQRSTYMNHEAASCDLRAQCRCAMAAFPRETKTHRAAIYGY